MLTDAPLLLKTRLLCQGVKAPPEVGKGRRGGAGLAGGRYIALPGTVTLTTNIPLQGAFIERSPFSLTPPEANTPGGPYLLSEGPEEVAKVRVLEEASFLQASTSDGVPMWKLASIHGHETLGVTLDKVCRFWGRNLQCQFCAIQQNIKSHEGLSLARKEPRHIAETVAWAERVGGCRHVTMTSGLTDPPGHLLQRYIACLEEVRKASRLPVHIQMEPPDDFEAFQRLKEAGADTVGLHIETLDEAVRAKVCPGKARTPRTRYVEAWRRAVEVFGENQVSTFIILGLGENRREVVKGLEDVVSSGAIPYPVPFRPLAQTPLAGFPPSTPQYVLDVLRVFVDGIRAGGIDPSETRAGCVRCGACSPLKEFMRYRP